MNGPQPSFEETIHRVSQRLLGFNQVVIRLTICFRFKAQSPRSFKEEGKVSEGT
jgi:hypothetical protein